MLLRSILPWTRPKRHELWALRDVSFSVEPGETVGILGRNGAGKTTMLRLLAGVTQPSAGAVDIRGRVAPLLSVGVGFHQEMSGRENIFVNGMLLGLTEAEVRRRFDEIVDFAEIGEFIDTPVKFYSSGMFCRLGFAVAAHVDPQVLLVDEVLAVGDIAFQLKCFERMRRMQADGTTIVLVSHSMHAIRLLCPRALLFRKGRLEFDGDPEEAISRHHQFLALDSTESDHETASLPVTFLERSLTRDRAEANSVTQDDQLEARWRVRFNLPVDSPHLVFRILSEDGALAYGMQTTIGERWRSYGVGDEAEAVVRFQPRFGGGGTFRLVLDVTDQRGVQMLGTDLDGPTFYVTPRLGTTGIADAAASVAVDGRSMTDHQDLLLAPRRAT